MCYELKRNSYDLEVLGRELTRLSDKAALPDVFVGFATVRVPPEADDGRGRSID